MSVRDMLASMDSEELTGWQHYFMIEPYGDERADLRSAIVASLVANTARDPKKRADPFRPSDFMPFTEQADSAKEDVSAKIVKLFGAPTDG